MTDTTSVTITKIPLKGGYFRTEVPWKELEVGDPLTFVPDPLGVHTGDSHPEPLAIAVYWDVYHIGYLAKETAALIAPLLQNNLIKVIPIISWSKGSYQVELTMTIQKLAPSQTNDK